MKTNSRIASLLGLLMTFPTFLAREWAVFLRVTLPICACIVVIAFPLGFLIPAYVFRMLGHLDLPDGRLGLLIFRLLAGGVVFAGAIAVCGHGLSFLWFYFWRGIKILFGKHFTVEEFRSLRQMTKSLQRLPLFSRRIYFLQWRFELWLAKTKDYLRSLRESPRDS